MTKTICFDFDGVCATYDGWKGHNIFGDPIVETANLTKKLKANGFSCTLWTCREVTPELSEWLAHHGFEFDYVKGEKPMAIMYIDDRAVKFTQSVAGHETEKILSMLNLTP